MISFTCFCHLFFFQEHENVALLLLDKIHDSNICNIANSELKTWVVVHNWLDSHLFKDFTYFDTRHGQCTYDLHEVYCFEQCLFNYFFLNWVLISFRPLHIAARYGLTPVVQDLITKGSSVYALDENGMTIFTVSILLFSFFHFNWFSQHDF